jgi:hypothetical protein
LTMRRLREQWTPEEDERLRVLTAKGASDLRAAAALGRRKGMVRARAKKLGCPFAPLRMVRKKWADMPDDVGPRDHLKPFAPAGRMIRRSLGE